MGAHRIAATVAAVLAAAIAAAPADARLRAPALESPAAGAAVETSPTLTWTPVKGAAAYDVQLAADPQFGSIAASIRTVNTAATRTTTLIDGSYFWRVRAISATKTAGRWSAVRTLQKRWASTPELLAPTTDFGAVWPTSPLVLKWSAVAHATSYIVVVATDPSLAQPVLGSVKDPQTTQGTVLAFPGTLNAGTYYWQVTPVDSDGHKGTPSPVGRFNWGWPSGLSVAVEDRNPAPEVFDPLLTWTAVGGAAHYDVEVNTTPDFAPGSRFWSATVDGTAVSPVTPVPNNTYFWRVRAVDADGRAGTWASGTFRKEFDDVEPDTITGLTVREGWTDPGATPSDPLPAVPLGGAVKAPVLTWTPVTGAAEYEVQVAPRDGAQCNWGAAPSRQVAGRTPNPFFDVAKWTTSSLRRPGPLSWPATQIPGHPLADGEDYCVRVLARDGAGVLLASNRNDSRWTYQPRVADQAATGAFTYTAPAVPADPPPCPAPLAQPAYVSPGPSTSRTPLFTWSGVPGAKSYYVVVARDDGFTEIKEVGFTDRPFYAPTSTFEDEDTHYYWAVWPAPRADGQCFAQGGGSAAFDKRSDAPVLQAPADGTVQADQPVLSWLSAEGAADYRVQVARDPSFRDLVDDVTTASTAYASDKTYPVDTALFWRVRARDRDKVELAWSAARSFRRTLPAPVPDAANPAGGGTIPVLAWNPVPGAVSYDFHVDKVDGKSQDFTVATPRFTPTEFYGNGTWKWRVRANFPSRSTTVAGPYTGTVDYVRRILAPTGLRTAASKGRVLLSWDPDVAGRKYRVEVARDDSFTDLVESVTTTNTSYAPRLDRGYTAGGRFLWRVAVLDKGNNLGAWARGDLHLAPRLQVRASRTVLLKRRRTTVVLTVTDGRGTRVRAATVVAKGAGVVRRARTSRTGRAVLRLRPGRKGSIVVTVTRKGYVGGRMTVKVL